MGIFGAKKQWIIGQKSQNSAWYAGAFWGKNHFFWEKSQSKPGGFSRGRASAGPQRRGWGVESAAFKAKNNALTTSEYLQNNF